MINDRRIGRAVEGPSDEKRLKGMGHIINRTYSTMTLHKTTPASGRVQQIGVRPSCWNICKFVLNIFT